MQRLCHRLNLAPLRQRTIPGGGEMLEARPRGAFCLIKGCSAGGRSSAGPLLAGTRAGEGRMGVLLPPPLSPTAATKLAPAWGLPPPQHSSSGCPGGGRSWGRRAPCAPWHTGLSLCPPTMELPHARSCMSLHDHNSLGIKIPGIVPAGPHAGNCLLLNLPLKISWEQVLPAPASCRGDTRLWGAGGRWQVFC